MILPLKESFCFSLLLKWYCCFFHVYSQVQRCNSTVEDSFLFKEERVGKHYQYTHRIINGTMRLGVSRNCDENLSFLSTTRLDRRCSFKKLKKWLPRMVTEIVSSRLIGLRTLSKLGWRTAATPLFIVTVSFIVIILFVPSRSRFAGPRIFPNSSSYVKFQR